MEIFDVVKKLTGKINPVGSSEIDNERFENLKVYCELFDKMHTELCDIAWENKDMKQFSIKNSVDYINKILDKLSSE